MRGSVRFGDEEAGRLPEVTVKEGFEELQRRQLTTHVKDGFVWIEADCGRKYCMAAEEWNRFANRVSTQVAAAQQAERPSRV